MKCRENFSSRLSWNDEDFRNSSFALQHCFVHSNRLAKCAAAAGVLGLHRRSSRNVRDWRSAAFNESVPVPGSVSQSDAIRGGPLRWKLDQPACGFNVRDMHQWSTKHRRHSGRSRFEQQPGTLPSEIQSPNDQLPHPPGIRSHEQELCL